jgi:TadE-like protein
MISRIRPANASMRRAVAATELAVLLPFLAFIWVVAIDWARIFYYTVTLEYCARDGAYYASNYPGIYDYTSLQDAAFGESTNINPQPTVTPTYYTDATGASCVQIDVGYTFNTITNFPAVPSTTNITKTVKMRMAPLLPGT